MKRLLYWLNTVLLISVIGLSFGVWKQRQERSRWLDNVSMAAAQVAQLQSFPETTRQDAPESDASAIAAKPVAEKPSRDADDAVRSERKRLEEERNRREERLNALNGYDIGFVALKIPPQTVAYAKEIILRPSERYDAIRRTTRSLEEARPEYETVRAETNAGLVALLGRETFEELEAYKLQTHFDWTIGTDLWDGGAPLTNDQLHALTLAIVRVGYDDQLILTAPKPAQIPDPATWLSQQDSMLLAATNHFLLPPQQELLQKNLVEENRYNAAMRAAVAHHAMRSPGAK